MLPQSMTGYGRGFSGNFKVEIRSSNHKNIDIHINIPYYLFSHEPIIKKVIRSRFNRGRIEIFIPKQEIDTVRLKVNKPLAREYYNALVELKDELSLSDDVGINMLTSQRDIFLLDEPEIDIEGLNQAVDMAMEELEKSRAEEGKNLVEDISQRIGIITSYVDDVERERERFINASQEKLSERLKELMGELEIDESRIIQETAMLVERSDITEELVRMQSHLKHFTEVLSGSDTIGKKLDFIIQELRREINTIGSKAQSYDIASVVVEVKHELEKIREQVQNLQ